MISDYDYAYPSWRYRRLPLIFGDNYFIKELSPNHDYLLHGIVTKTPPQAGHGDISPYLSLSLIQVERGRPLIDDPVETILISSPGNSPPSGRDVPLKYYHAIDYLFSFADRLIIKIQAVVLPVPAWIDILCLGRNLKRKKLSTGV